jgi:hypothetical protein
MTMLWSNAHIESEIGYTYVETVGRVLQPRWALVLGDGPRGAYAMPCIGRDPDQKHESTGYSVQT